MLFLGRRHGRRLTALVALIVAAVLLSVVAVAAASTTTAKSNAAANPILIGASSVLSGPNAYAGKDWLNGLELGIKQINASGGVNGRQIKIVTADNACDPATAVGATRKLIGDHPSIILGSVCSGATLAAMPLVKAAHIVQLTDDSSSPQITQEAGIGGNPWEFRINLDSSMEAGALSRYVAAKVKSVYFIAENDAFGRDGVTGYTQELQKAHISVAGSSYYTTGTGDFSPILSAVQQANPGGLVLISEPKDAATLLRQLRSQGLTQPIFDGGGFLSQEFFSALGDPKLADGIVGAFFWNAAEDPALAKAYKKAYGTAPAPDSIGPYYDAYVLRSALQIAKSTDPTAIRNALKKVNLKQAWGTIKFDAHNQAHPNVALQTATNGQIKLLKVVPSSGE
jgi:branched-chain amino acid transport system substrate-binding protein